MSRAFAPPEQGEPENKAEVRAFKAYLRSLHDPVSEASDTGFWKPKE